MASPGEPPGPSGVQPKGLKRTASLRHGEFIASNSQKRAEVVLSRAVGGDVPSLGVAIDTSKESLEVDLPPAGLAEIKRSVSLHDRVLSTPDATSGRSHQRAVPADAAAKLEKEIDRRGVGAGSPSIPRRRLGSEPPPRLQLKTVREPSSARQTREHGLASSRGHRLRPAATARPASQGEIAAGNSPLIAQQTTAPYIAAAPAGRQRVIVSEPPPAGTAADEDELDLDRRLGGGRSSRSGRSGGTSAREHSGSSTAKEVAGPTGGIALPRGSGKFSSYGRGGGGGGGQSSIGRPSPPGSPPPLRLSGGRRFVGSPTSSVDAPSGHQVAGQKVASPSAPSKGQDNPPALGVQQPPSQKQQPGASGGQVEWQAPSRIEGYKVGRPLGEGGFGTVYQATGPDGKQVALKFLSSGRGAFDTTEDASRVATEAQVLSSIRHPHIVELLEVVVVSVHTQPGKQSKQRRDGEVTTPPNGTSPANQQARSESSAGVSDADGEQAAGPGQRCSVLVLQYAPGGNLKQEIRRRATRKKAMAQSLAIAAAQETDSQTASDGKPGVCSTPVQTAKAATLLALPEDLRSVDSQQSGPQPAHWEEALRTGLYGAYSESDAGRIANQLASALTALHSKHVAHLDIKPDNVLLLPPASAGARSTGASLAPARRPGGVHCLLTDFGLAHHYAPGQKLKVDAGSLPYLPPEVLRGKPAQPASVDIWSLGVTLYACLLGKLPFRPDSHLHLYEHLERAATSDREDGGRDWLGASPRNGRNHRRGRRDHPVQHGRKGAAGNGIDDVASLPDSSPRSGTMQAGIAGVRTRARSNSPESLAAKGGSPLLRHALRPRAHTEFGPPRSPDLSPIGRHQHAGSPRHAPPASARREESPRSIGVTPRGKRQRGGTPRRDRRPLERKRTASVERIQALLQDIAPSESDDSGSSHDEAEARSPTRGRRARELHPTAAPHRDRKRSLESSRSSDGSEMNRHIVDLPRVKPRSAQGLTRDAILFGQPLLPTFLSTEVRALLRSLLHKDPALRPSAASLKRHTPWQTSGDGVRLGTKPPWLAMGLSEEPNRDAAGSGSDFGPAERFGPASGEQRDQQSIDVPGSAESNAASAMMYGVQPAKTSSNGWNDSTTDRAGSGSASVVEPTHGSNSAAVTQTGPDGVALSGLRPQEGSLEDASGAAAAEGHIDRYVTVASTTSDGEQFSLPGRSPQIGLALSRLHSPDSVRSSGQLRRSATSEAVASPASSRAGRELHALQDLSPSPTGVLARLDASNAQPGESRLSPSIGGGKMMAARSPALSTGSSFRRGRRGPVPAIRIDLNRGLSRMQTMPLSRPGGRPTAGSFDGALPLGTQAKSPQHASSPSLVRAATFSLPTAPAVVAKSKPKMFGASFDASKYDALHPGLGHSAVGTRRDRARRFGGSVRRAGLGALGDVQPRPDKASELLSGSASPELQSASPGVATGRLSGMGGSMRGRLLGEAAAQGRLARTQSTGEAFGAVQLGGRLGQLRRHGTDSIGFSPRPTLQATKIRRGGATGAAAGDSGSSSPNVRSVVAMARRESAESDVSSPSLQGGGGGGSREMPSLLSPGSQVTGARPGVRSMGLPSVQRGLGGLPHGGSTSSRHVETAISGGLEAGIPPVGGVSRAGGMTGLPGGLRAAPSRQAATTRLGSLRPSSISPFLGDGPRSIVHRSPATLSGSPGRSRHRPLGSIAVPPALQSPSQRRAAADLGGFDGGR